MKRVVLIGSSSFVGKSLVDLLQEKELPFLGLSSQDLNLLDPQSSDKLSSLLAPDDVVVILAALTPRYGKGQEIFVQNIALAHNILTALQKAPSLAQVIYISSDAVYPFSDSLVTEESFAEPKDLYGVMHLARELMCKASLTVPLTICRPTLIYGFHDPHNSYGPNRMRRQAFTQKEISLFGNGEEMRDHIFVEDVAKLLLLLMERKYRGIVNLVTGQSISYLALSEKISALFTEEIRLKTSPRQNLITHRHYDTHLLRDLFPNFSFTSLDEGLKKVHEEECQSRGMLDVNSSSSTSSKFAGKAEAGI